MANKLNIATVAKVKVNDGLELVRLDITQKLNDEMTSKEEKDWLKKNIQKVQRAVDKYAVQGKEIHIFLGLSRTDKHIDTVKRLHAHGFVLANNANTVAQAVCDTLNKRKSGKAVAFKHKVTWDKVTAMSYYCGQCEHYRTYSANGVLDFDTLINSEICLQENL